MTDEVSERSEKTISWHAATDKDKCYEMQDKYGWTLIDIKPIADITGLKHNTFAIVGKVLQTLKENNWTEDKIKVARTDMTANGGKINDLFAIANKYVQVVEAGLPVIMDSGIPA